MTDVRAIADLTAIADIDGVLLLGFAVAILVLEFFDISLPRGDTLGVSGAVDSAAIVVLGPFAAVVAGFLGTTAAFAARRGADRHTHPAIEMPSMVVAFVAAITIHQLWGSAQSGSASYYARSFAVASCYLAAELITVQFLMARDNSRSAVRLIRGNAVRQAPLLAAQLSASVLTVIIFPYMGVWGIALVVVLLLLIRQSYAMLLDIRETYRTTIEVLVEAAEIQDSRRRGHSERTAGIAREIGMLCGLPPSEIERISYAALLHDVDAIGHESGDNQRAVCRPSEVLAGVGSFAEVVKVLQILESAYEGIPTEADILSAYVVALANDIDATGNPELRLLHGAPALDGLRGTVPGGVKARAVAAALRLGYAVPAVS